MYKNTKTKNVYKAQSKSDILFCVLIVLHLNVLRDYHIVKNQYRGRWEAKLKYRRILTALNKNVPSIKTADIKKHRNYEY